MTLTIINGTSVQIDAAIAHNQQGCVAHESDTVAGEFIYSKLRADGTPSFDSEPGYTEKYTVVQDGKKFIQAENKIDFTNKGLNTGIPNITNIDGYNSVTAPIDDPRFFVRRFDNFEYRHLIYSVAPAW